MNNKLNPKEKFNEEFIKIAFPEWMRSDKKSHDFRGFVLDKHMILENLLDLLIAAYFLAKLDLKNQSFLETVCLLRWILPRRLKF